MSLTPQQEKQMCEAIVTIESFNPRAIDELTLEKVEALRKEAAEKDMDIDWDRACLVPYATDLPRESRFARDDEGDHLRIDEQGLE